MSTHEPNPAHKPTVNATADSAEFMDVLSDTAFLDTCAILSLKTLIQRIGLITSLRPKQRTHTTWLS